MYTTMYQWPGRKLVKCMTTIAAFCIGLGYLYSRENWRSQLPPPPLQTKYDGKLRSSSNASVQPQVQERRVFPERTLQANQDPSLVLLVTYFRSGSTLTADIIQEAQNVFYVYEPLKRYSKREIMYYSQSGVCYPNNTCVPAVSQTERYSTIYKHIRKFYKCGMIRERKFMWNIKKSKELRKMTNCIHEKGEECYETARFSCLKSSRLIKTIRLSMDLIGSLMKRVSDLKIVHLLRDPRGLINSRINANIRKYDKLTLREHARAACNRFEKDINITLDIRKMYPDRIKLYLYEEIAEHPIEASKSILTFLNLQPTMDYDAWLHNHTFAGVENGYYDTSRANSSLTANVWRLHLSFENVRIVEKECVNVFTLMGLLPTKSAEILKNLKIPLRSESKLFDNYF